MNIGERCNVAGPSVYRKVIVDANYDKAIVIAKKHVEQGAQVNDINLNDGLIKGVAEMTEFVNLLIPDSDASKSPLLTYSSKLEDAETGLKCNLGKCIGNSVSKKEGETPCSEPLDHQPEMEKYGRLF